MSDSCSRQRTAFSPGRFRMTAVGFLLIAAGACTCEDPGFGDRFAQISADPEAITLEGIPGKFVNVRVEITNSGNTPLSLSREPFFVESDDDGNVEYAVVSLFEKACDGTDRTAANARTEIAAGDCAALVFRYLPVNEGDDAAVLRFESNARNSDGQGFYDLVINGSAFTPAIEVCVFDGDSEVGCWDPTDGLIVDYGVVTPGETHERRVEVRSVGTRTLRVEQVELDGVEDYGFSPTEFPQDVPSGETFDVTVSLDLLLSGLRSTDLLIHSNDPTNPLVTVSFMAVGDGPGVCLCVTVPGEPCVRPTSTADFGDVTLLARADRVLHVASCGTKDLELNSLALVNDRGAFTSTPPALPATLPPGQRAQVDLSFSPQVLDQYLGRLNIDSNVEGSIQPFLVLRGQGVESGCKLEPAASVVNFGDVSEGVTARRFVDLANTGSEHCTIPENAAVATLTGGDFALASSPNIPTPVAPGEVVQFEVSFTPNSASGTSTGEFSVGYAPDQPGAATLQIKVSLTGTATERGPCKLTAQPDSATGGIPGFPGFPGMGGRELSFGNVRVGRDKVMTITIQNVGGDVCTLNPAQIRAGAFPLPELDNSKDFSIIKQPRQLLQPGDQTTIDVRFAPTKEIEAMPPGFNFTAPSIALQTSDHVTFAQGCGTSGFPPVTNPGAVCWNLSGSGVRADILVVPKEIDFGLVTLGCGSREQRVTLYNIGGDAIQVQSTDLHPPTASQFFRVAGGGTFTIPVGGQRDLRVRFIPPPAGPAQPHDAIIRILSDASNLPQVDVPVAGGGTTQSHQTDSFTQASEPSADVLFVIDDSGSMSEEQGALSTNAQAFLQAAEDTDTDYHVGVVTTDMSDSAKSGRFQGSPKVVTPATPNAAGVLGNTINRLGTNGSGTEKGLQAMVAALTEPLISNENTGFIREDAALAVVIVSDEDDFSSGAVDFYVDFLRNFKGTHNSHMVKMHAIVGPPGGCSSGNGDATAAPRYAAVQSATGGQFQSICNQNWGDMARQMGIDIFDGWRGFRLSRVLDPDQPHTVKVNGTERPQGTWEYDSDTNNIVFDSNHVPEGGSTIEVSYEALCFAIN